MYLVVGPGKPEDNVVLVVDDSNKLSFTMFRPSCLKDGNGLKEINAEIWLENSCKMKIKWIQSEEDYFDIFGGDAPVKVPSPPGPAQVDLDGKSANYSFPGADKWGAAPCILNLKKVPDGNGYLANISLRGTPKIQAVQAFVMGNPESLASDSLSTPAIVGISVGVVGAVAVLGLICLLLYCCLFKKEKKDGNKKAQPVVPKEEEQKQMQAVEGRASLDKKKPSKATQPVPPKQSGQEYVKKKSIEPVVIVVEPPKEELLKPKSQPKQVIKPNSQPKQVIKRSVSDEVPKSPPMPKGVPVGYRPEDCKEIAKVQDEFEKHPEWRSSWHWIEGRDGRDHMYWTRLSDQYVPRRQLIGMNSIANDPRNMTPEQKKLEKVRVAKFIAKQKLCGFGDPSTDDEEKFGQQPAVKTDKTQQSEKQPKKRLNKRKGSRRKKKRDKRDAAVDESEAKQ
uniref:Uncharacterized protein n=1 Tax=Ditylenchus dipsaci TaxID=166011 RepID=A0A915DYN1_9BILA